MADQGARADPDARAEPSFAACLLAGGAAGTSVDVALFPLDTVKTRLQAPEGFLRAGGFRGIYNGLSAAAAGSAPGAALFFGTYEFLKPVLGAALGGEALGGEESPGVHMAAASGGEVMACLVRVPTEIIKQRMQAGMISRPSVAIPELLRAEGVAGFYRGYWTTILREIPFSVLQFPMYEALKAAWARRQGRACEPHEAAVAGSLAGATSACVTTPLDVAKTRLMLGADAAGVPYKGTWSTLARVHAEGGLPALYAGVAPRTMWIGIGGFVFFGAYEGAKSVVSRWV